MYFTDPQYNSSDVTLTENKTTSCIHVSSCVRFYIMIYSTALVISVIGLLGNVFALVVLVKQSTKTSHVVLLQMLSATDGALMLTSSGIYVFKLMIYLSTDYHLDGKSRLVTLSILSIAFDILQYTSIWVLVYLATDRFIAIRFPFSATSWCKVSTTYKVYPVILLASVCVTAPRLFYFTQGIINQQNPFYNTIATALRYFIPVSILMILNTQLILSVYRATSDSGSFLNNQLRRTVSRNRNSRRNSKNATANLLVVVVIFLVCGICRGTFWILAFSFYEDIFSSDPWLYSYVDGVSQILMIISSAINFFVYCLFYKRFQETLIQLICPKYTSKQNRAM